MAINFPRRALPVSHVEEVPQTPRRQDNPFDRAAGDLAVRWEEMVTELEQARDELESTRGQNVYLAERVDSLTRELATLRQFTDLELARQTARSDRAVEENAARRSALQVIIRALQMVLDEHVASEPHEPAQQPPAPPAPPQAARQPEKPRSPEPARNPHRIDGVHREDDEDTQPLRQIIDRLAPPVFTHTN